MEDKPNRSDLMSVIQSVYPRQANTQFHTARPARPSAPQAAAQIWSGGRRREALALLPDWPGLLAGLPRLGRVRVVTLNGAAVHAQSLVFTDVIRRKGQVYARAESAGIRWRADGWAEGWAVREEAGESVWHSLQFFSACGTVTQEIYLTPESAVAAYCFLVARYRLGPVRRSTAAPAQAPVLPPAPVVFSEIEPSLLPEVLSLLARAGFRVRVETGTGGVVQIYDGPLPEVLATERSLEVRGPGLRLHVHRALIGRVCIEAGTEDTNPGLCLYDRAHRRITAIRGGAAPDDPQTEAWSDLLAALPCR